MSKPPRTGRSLADLIEAPAEEQTPPTASRSRPAYAIDGKAMGKTALTGSQGGKPKTFFVTPTDSRYLAQVGLDAEMSLHDMAREAMSEWLEKRGLRALEPQSANRQATGRKRD